MNTPPGMLLTAKIQFESDISSWLVESRSNYFYSARYIDLSGESSGAARDRLRLILNEVADNVLEAEWARMEILNEEGEKALEEGRFISMDEIHERLQARRRKAGAKSGPKRPETA